MLEPVENLFESELYTGENFSLTPGDGIPAHRTAGERNQRESRREK